MKENISCVTIPKERVSIRSISFGKDDESGRPVFGIKYRIQIPIMKPTGRNSNGELIFNERVSMLYKGSVYIPTDTNAEVTEQLVNTFYAFELWCKKNSQQNMDIIRQFNIFVDPKTGNTIIEINKNLEPNNTTITINKKKNEHKDENDYMRDTIYNMKIWSECHVAKLLGISFDPHLKNKKEQSSNESER